LTRSTRRSTTWSFLAPALSRPAGGLIAMFEIANEIARRGQGRVQIVHVPTPEAHVRSEGDVAWFQFEPEVEQHFTTDLDPEAMPPLMSSCSPRWPLPSRWRATASAVVSN